MAESKTRNKPVTGKYKLDLIEMALRKIQSQLEGDGEFKATLADLIRLIEAHDGMQKMSGPTGVTVGWVEKTKPTEE